MPKTALKHEPEFEIVLHDEQGAYVAERIKGRLQVLHHSSIFFEAAEWLLQDLRNDPGTVKLLRRSGSKIVRIYDRAIEIRNILDSDLSVTDNALKLAKAEQSKWDEDEIPF